jgi:hypothetical protein
MAATARLRLLALAALLLAVAAAGCHGARGPSPDPLAPCPPGWHRVHDAAGPGLRQWSCVTAGALSPWRPQPAPDAPSGAVPR